MKSPMRSKQIKPIAGINPAKAGAPFFREELLLTVREATNYLGSVSNRCIVRWSESRFPTSAWWVEISVSRDRVLSHSARRSNQR
jgi:hypothetical protein